MKTTTKTNHTHPTIKTVIFLGTLILSLSIAVFAQQNTFSKVFYDNAGGIQAHCFQKTNDNHFLIGGEKDYFPMILKMDSEGAIIWKKQLSNINGVFTTMCQASDSSFIAGSILDGPYGILIYKFNASGDTLCTRFYQIESSWIQHISINPTYDGGGIVSLIITSNNNDRSPLIFKLDHLLNIEWGKRLSSSEDDMYAYNTKQTPDSGYIISGKAYNDFFWISKLSPSGEIQWSKSLPLSTSFGVRGFDIDVLEDGFLFFNSSDFALIKTDFDGNLIWAKETNFSIDFGFWGSTPKIQRTSDGGFVFGGIFGMMKVDSVGNSLWAQEMFFYLLDIAETANGGIMTVGNGPMIGVSMTETTNPQIGIIKTDSEGNSSECVYPSNYTTSDIYPVFEPFQINTSTSEIVETNIEILTSEPTIDIDTGCVAIIGAIANPTTKNTALSIYPNPSSGVFHMDLNQTNYDKFKRIEIYNTNGVCIYKSTDPAIFTLDLDLNNQPEGVYFLKSYFDKEVVSQPLIILR